MTPEDFKAFREAYAECRVVLALAERSRRFARWYMFAAIGTLIAATAMRFGWLP